jgi:starch synthase
MVSSEATPWAKSGGLADVLGALPPALAKIGYPVGVVIPHYMHAGRAPADRIIDRLPIFLGGHTYDCAVWRLIADGVITYFVENPGFYGRDGLYGDRYGDYGDNHLRFALLSKAAIEISRLDFHAHIFHCHDWQSGLVPLYLKNQPAIDPTTLTAKSIITIHNLGYQGDFGRERMGEMNLPDWMFRPDLIEMHGRISLLKAGLVYADRLTTVSRKYAEEIQTPEYGFGLDGLLRARSSSLTGILNGVDYDRWNPEADPALPAHYNTGNLAGKEICKRELIREMRLPETAADRPMIGIVSRFAWQKGFDFLAERCWELLDDDVSLVVLGNGEQRYEDLFRTLQYHRPDKVAIWIGYNDGLAHRIEAGCDIFLMPSVYEPCGLNQIYSLRYGTVPVVRATGGLDDTISEDPKTGTGFKFTDYNGGAMLHALRSACRAWQDRRSWKRMMVRGMLQDFSWHTAALEYSKLYQRLHPFGA